MLNEEFITSFLKGPSILLLGQRTLSLNNRKDYFIEKVIQKYQSENSNQIYEYDYNTLFKLENLKDYHSASIWMENLCRDISVPLWLETVSRLPWSHIYTSTIDTIIPRAFEADWRKIQPIYDDRYKVLDPRNKFNLHLTYLFGCISQIEEIKKAPIREVEKARRKFISDSLLRRMPEIATPKGVLLIEGYNEDKDWLKIEDLASLIYQFNNNQVLICSVSEHFINNEIIKDLILSEKLIARTESLAEIILYLETDLKVTFSAPEDQNYLGKWISIGDQKVPLPQDLINQVSKTATIIEDSMFYTSSFKDEDEKYLAFKTFLGFTNTIPNWIGYPNGFAFKREFYLDLKTKVLNKIQANTNKDVPLILYGQTSSGKTVALGLLAYEISQIIKLPVLFIEKRYLKIEEKDIDIFCKWAEDRKAKNTVIIWDGMLDPDSYYSLLRKLNTRGRNLILIGTTYNIIKHYSSYPNYIETPINLTYNEKQGFLTFLKEIDPIISNFISGLSDNNFLSMLYRALPISRKSITSGLKAEFDFFAKHIRENSEIGNSPNSNNLSEALLKAGLLNQTDYNLSLETREIENEEYNIVDLLIFSIMIPGQFALNVPYELLMRVIGYQTFSNKLFKSLSSVDLITWVEDSQGNIMLGPRTAFEAKILINYLGGTKAQVEFINLLLKEVKSLDISSNFYESNTEIQFAVELLNNISPNTTDKYINYLYDIAQILKVIRESKQAYHPRLILKEASFLREIVKSNIVDKTLFFELLERAETIVREALEQLKTFKERTITNYLRVELASILGTRVFEYSKESIYAVDAKETYELVKGINNYAFASNPENYNALDVLAWTTESLIRNDVFTKSERLNAEAEMLNLFEMAESEGISEQNKDKFRERKFKFYDLIGKEELADSIFEELEKSGSSVGYYIRAKKILGPINFELTIDKMEYLKRYTQVFKYLSESFDKIKRDGRCLFLLLKCWWVTKTGDNIFSNEKQALPFSYGDWKYCFNLLEILMSIEEKYQLATTYYLKGLCEFHLGHYRSCFETFKVLDIETDFSLYGRRRVMKSYLASTNHGSPKIFKGEVKRSVSYIQGDKVGEIYVSEIREYIPFILNEFNSNSFQKGDIIDKFNIGFNFRGPIAAPIKL